MATKTKIETKNINLAAAIVEDEKHFARETRSERQMGRDGWALFEISGTGVFEIEGLVDYRFSCDDMGATKAMLKAAAAGNVVALKQLLFLMAKIARPVIDVAVQLEQHSCCEGIEDIAVVIPAEVAETAARAVF